MTRPRQVSDEQILRGARACLLEHGPSVSTTLIAERLGISQAVLFQRFGTKRELIRAALLPDDSLPLRARLERGPDGRELNVQLLEIGMQFSQFFDDVIPRLELLRTSGESLRDACNVGGEPGPVQAHRAMAKWFEKAQTTHRMGPCDPEHVAYFFLGALYVRPFHGYLRSRPVSAEERSEYVASLVDLLSRAFLSEQPKRARKRVSA